MMKEFDNYLKTFKKRGLALLVDDSTARGKAVLFSPAQCITETRVAEILNISGGLLGVGMSVSRAEAFRLPDMGRPLTESASAPTRERRFTVSVEAREGVGTGISARDRATTIQILGEEVPNPRKLVSPGHIFPIILREGGVLIRSALFEGALDINQIAGYRDSVALCDALAPNGEYLDAAGTQALALKENIPCSTLSELIRYRLESEQLVYRVAEAKLPTRDGGEMRSIVYRSKLHYGEHIALVKGTIDPEKPVVTRVQLEFTFGDVFGGDNPPSRKQITYSLRALEKEQSGIFLYLRRPRKGQISSQVAAWQSSFDDKPASSMREYGLGAQILRDLGAKKIALLTDSPKEFSGIESFGIEIISQQNIPYTEAP